MSGIINISMMLHALLLASLLAASHGLLKWAAQHTGHPFSFFSKRALGISASLAVYGLVIFLYIHVLRTQDITRLYPAYTGLSILLVLLVGALFFSERLGKSKIIGCCLIIAGVCLIGK